MRPTAVTAAAGLALVLSSAVVGTSEEGETRALTVLHTSDLHGWVLPFDDRTGEPTDHSLAHVATLVATVRAEGRPTLLLDSGDTIQGTPLEAVTHLRRGQPSPTITAMNAIGYDAMAVGNHDFNFGLATLARARAQAAFPFLSANTVDAASGEPAFPPYRVMDVAGVRVGILGLTTSNIPAWERPEHYRGLRFVPPPEAARAWVPRLRGEQRCDLVIVLLHAGFEQDPATGASTGTAAEDFAARVAAVPGIDLLLSGHTHQSLPPRRLGDTIVAQPGAHAREVTRLDLELATDGDGWRLTSWSGSNLAVAELTPSAALVARFAAERAAVAAVLDAPLTTATAPVSVAGCRLADCAAGDLVHQAQLAATGAELSLAAVLSDATPDLATGPVTWRWVHALYVYPNTLSTVRVSGAQVKDLLEHAARYYDGLDCPAAGGGCTVLTDPAIATYNVDTMAGVGYRVDPTRREGDRVRDLSFAGRPLDLHRSFTLACNNYRRAGGGAYPHLATAEEVWVSSTEVADLVGEFLTTQRPWQPTVDGNWLVAPSIVGEKHLSEGPRAARVAGMVEE